MGAILLSSNTKIQYHTSSQTKSKTEAPVDPRHKPLTHNQSHTNLKDRQLPPRSHRKTETSLAAQHNSSLPSQSSTSLLEHCLPPISISTSDASDTRWPTHTTSYPSPIDGAPKLTGMKALARIDNDDANKRLSKPFLQLRERTIKDWKKKIGTHLAAIPRNNKGKKRPNPTLLRES